MDTDTFEFLLEKVTPLIKKQNTHLRESILPNERLSVTLRHLATGKKQNKVLIMVMYFVTKSFLCIIPKEKVKNR